MSEKTLTRNNKRDLVLLLATRQANIDVSLRLQGWIEASAIRELKTGKRESVATCLAKYVKCQIARIEGLPKKEVKS